MPARGIGEKNMAKAKYKRGVSRQARRKNRDHKGLPQMMVAVSAEPEFGGEARSLTSAYKYCKGEFVSAPMERIMREAMRRLGLEERAA